MLSIALSCLVVASPFGEIACVSRTPGQLPRVVVVDIASGSVRPVGPGTNDGAPVWSPDGAWLAFDTDSEDGRDIYAVRADGSQGRIVSAAHRLNGEPSWSPDSSRLAYAAGNDQLDRIIVRPLDTGREVTWGASDVALRGPVWMPDPRMISVLAESSNEEPSAALQWDVASGGLLATALVDTSTEDIEAARITTDIYVVTARHAFSVPKGGLPSTGRYVEWNARPDRRGRRLAYESNDGGDREIYMTTTEGAFNLTSHRAADWNPVWAPAGLFLAFESFRGGTRGIYRVNRETSRVETVCASGSGDFWAPSWSPDAQWIACAGNPDGRSQVYVVNARGGARVRVTRNDAIAFDSPAWRPVQ